MRDDTGVRQGSAATCELLRQHAAHQEMQPVAIQTQASDQLPGEPLGQTVRAADCEGKVAYTGIRHGRFLPTRRWPCRGRVHQAPRGRPAGTAARMASLTLLTACLPIVDFPQIDLPTKSLSIMFVKIVSRPRRIRPAAMNECALCQPISLRRVDITGSQADQLLDIVKIPNFRPEEMHDDVTGID